jgi:hypothetical protein
MQVRGAASVSFGRGRTMFSKPLAYPSTLDPRPRGRAPPRVDVLRGGVLEPEPRSRRKNRKLKPTLTSSDLFQRRVLRGFLSQAGPRFDLELIQAEHHLWFRR